MRNAFLTLSIAAMMTALGAGWAAATADKSAPPVGAGATDKAAPPAEPASKQPPAAAKPAPMQPPDPGAGSATQDQCEALMRTNKEWREKLRKQIEASLTDKLWKKVKAEFTADQADILRLEIQQQDAKLVARNKKHVVLAYAALWIITVLFVLQLWWRQRSLKEEIDRLQRDVKAAADED